ncbi:MAG: hypothetical protein AB8H79_00095 [Myxococcota bacterium]
MKRANIATILCLAGCASETQTLVQDGAERVPELESMWSTGAEYLHIGDARALAESETGVVLVDPRMPEPQSLGSATGSLDGGAWMNSKLLFSVDGNIQLWNGVTWNSPLRDALDGAAESVVADGDRPALWIRDASGWVHWEQERSFRVTIDGQEAAGPLAPGAQIDGTPVSWLAVDSAVAAVDNTGQSVESKSFDDVRSIATTADGSTWVADGVLLHMRTPQGEWVQYGFDSSVAMVYANPASDLIYVQTVDRFYSGTTDGVLPYRAPLLGTLSVDERGRLHGKDESGAWVADLNPAIAILDVPDGVMSVPTTFTVDPPNKANVTSVSLSIDGEATPLGAEPPWRLLVSPAEMTGADHTVTAKVGWRDGASEELTVPFTVAARDVTWDQDIRVLFEDRCGQCHGGTRETVLDQVDVWVLRFDEIMEEVETARMPLSQRPLDEDELALLNAWKAAGFPE